MNKPIVDYRNVSFKLERTDYFDKINLQIKEGETFVFYSIGNSGKSFLLRFVMGLVQPTDGQIIVNGEDIGGYDQDRIYEYRQHIRFVSRDSDLINNMNVFNNIALSLDFHTSMSQNELDAQVRKIIADLHLEAYQDEFPINLYENIKKRVALARAIIASPQILLMDECAYGYDEITAKGIIELLFSVIRERYTEKPLTTLITTSDLNLYSNYADRIGILFNRELIFVGTYEELVTASHPVIKLIMTGDPNLIKTNKEYFAYGSI